MGWENNILRRNVLWVKVNLEGFRCLNYGRPFTKEEKGYELFFLCIHFWHSREPQVPVRIVLLTELFFSSQKDYKTLHEVLVCFTPASNGKYRLQPSVPRLNTAPLGEDKQVCVSRSFPKDSLGETRLNFGSYSANQITRLCTGLVLGSFIAYSTCYRVWVGLTFSTANTL